MKTKVSNCYTKKYIKYNYIVCVPVYRILRKINLYAILLNIKQKEQKLFSQ